MKRITPLKLTCVGAFVAALGVGCASSGYARYDADTGSTESVGAPASADLGTRVSHTSETSTETMGSTVVTTTTTTDTYMTDEHGRVLATAPVEGGDRVTVSALNVWPDTRANWVNRFPFQDNNKLFHAMETYTFAPDDDASVREFTEAVSPGTLYSEAAGGTAVTTTGRGRVIQHSPNPR